MDGCRFADEDDYVGLSVTHSLITPSITTVPSLR
jgi:hypothetical protein